MVLSIDGTTSGRPSGRLKMGGGGVAPAEWRAQRTPNGVLSLPGLVAGPASARQPPGGVLSGGIPPDIMRGGAGAGPPGGPGRRRDSGGGMQWLPIGGMPARRGDGPGGYGARWNGAADGRHDFVPPMAGRNGAAYRQHSGPACDRRPAGGGGAWQGPNGALRGRWGVPRSRAVDRLHRSRPAGECGLCGISTWRSGEMSLCPERPMCRGRHAARRAWRWESVSPPVPALPADPASACPQARVLAPRTACAKGPMPGPALPGNGSGAAGFIPARPTPKRSGTCPDTQIGRTGRKRCLFAINDAGSGTLRGLRARREARPPLYRRNASCARRTYDRRTCGSGRGRQPGENPGTAFRGHLGADGAA